MELAYDGTDFAGWQVQPNAITVQQVLDEKLSIIYANQVNPLMDIPGLWYCLPPSVLTSLYGQ